MTHTSTEQPELTTAQECADYATSLRSTAMTIKLEGRTPPASFLRAAELFERAATELNLKDARVQELEASQAQRVPLALYQRDTIKANAWRETVTGGYWDVNDIIDATEAAHGITQEKQG